MSTNSTALISLNPNNENLTMSSREIAELINKNHSDLCRSIERLMAKQVIKGYQPMAYTHPQNGQRYKEYHLEKRDCLIVVAQNCPEFTAAVVDRWQELENQQKPTALIPNFDDPIAAAQAWIVEKQKTLELEHKVEEMQIDVNAFDRIATRSEGALNLTETAKHLQSPPRKLTQFLSSHRWIYKRAGGKKLDRYQDKLQSGLLEHKIHTATKDDGTEKICEQVLVTAKGLAKLSKMLESNLLN